MLDVVLIPGNMCDARLWVPVAEMLETEGHRVRHATRLDQRSIAAMADAVLSVENEPFVAVGFSMGAIVAAEMACRAPERVAAAALIAFNASADLPERAAVRPRQQEAVRGGALRTVIADELKPNYLADTNWGDAVLLETVMQMAVTLGPEVFVTQSEALRLRRDLRPGLRALRMPVLLACGSEDRLCPPEWHREWSEEIGFNASFDEIAQAGHLVPLEQPEALATALHHWLI